MTLSYVDLFAGSGGWSVGLDSLGWHNVGMYDWNESSARTARFNFRAPVNVVDLRGHSQLEFPSVDVVVGSPPCQGFSNEGYKRKDDPRNSLVWDFLEIVERIRPRVWIFENVPGLKRLHGGEYYFELRRRLEATDYQWNDFLIDSSEHGVPQVRQRFIVVASLDGPPTIPEPIAGMSLWAPQAKVSLWEAISDLPRVGTGDRVGIYTYPGPPESQYQAEMRRGSLKVHNHTTQNHSARVLEKIRTIRPGEGMRHLVGKYEENHTHYEGGYRRAEKSKPSWTAYWTRGMTSIHPEQDRFMSPREVARIQSFPDRFVFQGTTIENYTQICNAVPPLLAASLGRHVQTQFFPEENSPVGVGVAV